jgi:hypothetical protein
MISERIFQLWHYRVSHGQLLIRSPKSPTQTTNLDLVFRGVEFVHFPKAFKGLEVTEPTKEELDRTRRVVGPRYEFPKTFILVSEDKRYWIAAFFFDVKENDLDTFQSGLDGV